MQQQRQQETSTATNKAAAKATADERVTIDEDDSSSTSSSSLSSSTPPVKMSLGARVKHFFLPEGAPGKAYVMTEDELSHMTVTNILYFTSAVILCVLMYVLYADAF